LPSSDSSTAPVFCLLYLYWDLGLRSLGILTHCHIAAFTKCPDVPFALRHPLKQDTPVSKPSMIGENASDMCYTHIILLHLGEEIGKLLGLPHSPDAVCACMMWGNGGIQEPIPQCFANKTEKPHCPQSIWGSGTCCLDTSGFCTKLKIHILSYFCKYSWVPRTVVSRII
jgi:hypothetical protein